MSALLSILTLLAVQQSVDQQPKAAPPVEAQDPAAERVVCRRERVIGSRVATRKICMTARDRNRATDTTQREFGELIKQSTGGAAPQ